MAENAKGLTAETFKFFRDLAQRGFQAMTFHVLDAPGFDEDGEEPFAVHRLAPAVKIAAAGELERPGRFQFETRAFLDFRARPVHAAFLHDVFQPRVFAV